ncbi:MAG: hypothetical protein IPH18_13590 [Chitinophagaceae bacterium]|nr:hypothetical protein [Chitinophagaceae bacterium]
MRRCYFLFLFPMITVAGANAQTTYLPQGDKTGILLERMEIKARTDSFYNFSAIRPYGRRHIVAAAAHYQQRFGNNISKVDAYNIQRLMANSLEFIPAAERPKYASKKPFLKNFWQTPANMYEVHVKDFDLVINPMMNVAITKESNNDETLYQNGRGVYGGALPIKLVSMPALPITRKKTRCMFGVS